MSFLSYDLITDYRPEEIDCIDIHILDINTFQTIASSVIHPLPDPAIVGDYSRGIRLATLNRLPNNTTVRAVVRLFSNVGFRSVISQSTLITLPGRRCRFPRLNLGCRDGGTTGTARFF